MTDAVFDATAFRTRTAMSTEMLPSLSLLFIGKDTGSGVALASERARWCALGAGYRPQILGWSSLPGCTSPVS